jgi:hypothetical protein
MITISAFPGAGVPLDFSVEDSEGQEFDLSLWTVTATLRTKSGAVIADLAVSYTSDARLRSIDISGAQTAAVAGLVSLVKVVAVNPALPDLPVVDEMHLKVEPA